MEKVLNEINEAISKLEKEVDIVDYMLMVNTGLNAEITLFGQDSIINLYFTPEDLGVRIPENFRDLPNFDQLYQDIEKKVKIKATEAINDIYADRALLG